LSDIEQLVRGYLWEFGEEIAARREPTADDLAEQDATFTASAARRDAEIHAALVAILTPLMAEGPEAMADALLAGGWHDDD
jgi:hypothetical protein